MARDYKAHLIQWKHNRHFLALIPGRYPDWIVTVAFYTALHVIDALLAKDNNREVTNHDGRNSVLMDTNRYRRIWRAYHPLFGLSRTVRYLARPERWIPVDKIESNVFGAYLYPIEASALKLMAIEQKPAPVALKASEEDAASAAD